MLHSIFTIFVSCYLYFDLSVNRLLVHIVTHSPSLPPSFTHSFKFISSIFVFFSLSRYLSVFFFPPKTIAMLFICIITRVLTIFISTSLFYLSKFAIILYHRWQYMSPEQSICRSVSQNTYRDIWCFRPPGCLRSGNSNE